MFIYFTFALDWPQITPLYRTSHQIIINSFLLKKGTSPIVPGTNGDILNFLVKFYYPMI